MFGITGGKKKSAKKHMPVPSSAAVFSPTPGGTADQTEAKAIAKNEAAAAASGPAATGGHFVDTEGERLNPASSSSSVPAWHANPGWVPAGSGDAAVAGLNTDPSKGAYVLEQRPDKAAGNSTVFRMSDGTYKTYDPKVGLSDAGTWNSSEWNASKYASTTGSTVPAAPAPVISPASVAPEQTPEEPVPLHGTGTPVLASASVTTAAPQILDPAIERAMANKSIQPKGVTDPLPRHLSRPDEDLDPFGAFDSTPKGKSGP